MDIEYEANDGTRQADDGPKKCKTRQHDLGLTVLALVVFEVAARLLPIVPVCIPGLAKPETNAVADGIYQADSKRKRNVELTGTSVRRRLSRIGCASFGPVVYLLST